MTHQNGHDIPLISLLPGGTESDYPLSLKTFDRFVKASRENGVELKIAHFVGDGHHDSYAHYRYFGAKEVIPIIPLCESSKNGLLQIEGLSMADDGVPLCPGGIKMRHHQFDRAKQRHVYACPAKTGTHRNGQYQYVFRPELCPFKQDCAPHSAMAPWAYIPTRDNPRLFPPIPRDSSRFKLLYHERSSTERKNSTNKEVYKLKRSFKNAHFGQFRLTLIDIVEHVKLWYRVAREKLSHSQLFKQALQKLGLKSKNLEIPAGCTQTPSVNTA